MAVAFGTYAELVSTTQTGSSTTGNLTVAAGDTIVVAGRCPTSAAASQAVSDGHGNAGWTQWGATAHTGGGQCITLWYLQNAGAGTYSVTMTGTNQNGLGAANFSGLVTSGGPLGVSILGDFSPGSAGANLITPGTISISTVPAAIIGFCTNFSGEGGAHTQPVAGTSPAFTSDANGWSALGASAQTILNVSHRRITSAGSPAPGWDSDTTNRFDFFNMFGIAFAELGAGGGAATTGYITQPGPGPTDPFNVNQFRLAPRSSLVLPPPPPPSVGFIRPPGPGVGPSKRYQFTTPSRDQNAAVPFFPGPTTPGIASMMLMFRKR